MNTFTFKGYLLLLLNLIFGFAKAQVVYTDVNPDTVIHQFVYPIVWVNGFADGNKKYELDVNNDGIIDFRFFIKGFQDNTPDIETYFVMDTCSCDVRNEVVVDTINHQRIEVAPLNYGDVIFDPLPQGQNYPFSHFDSIYYLTNGLSLFQLDFYSYYDGQGPSNSGPWNAVTSNKYLGLKFYVNNVAYFGWIRISIYLLRWDPYFTIHEYAYEASGGSITAGAGSSFTGIDEISKSDFNVSPNPSDNEFVITSTITKIQTLKVFDTFGKLIEQQQINAGTTILKARSWASGIYFLQIEDGENKIVKKVIKTQ